MRCSRFDHASGFLSFKAKTAEGSAVRQAMDRVNVGSGLTYGGFYTGFGLSITATMLFYAFLCVGLGRLSAPKAARRRLHRWSFFAFQLPGHGAGVHRYRGAAGNRFLASAICLGWAAWLATRARRTPAQ